LLCNTIDPKKKKERPLLETQRKKKQFLTALSGSGTGKIHLFVSMTTTNDTNSDSDNGCFLVVSWMRITVPIERARLRMGEFINDVKFQTFIVSLIAINGIMLGIATCDFVRDDRMNAQILETFDLVCLILFTIEIGMQFAYWGWKLFQSGWLVFDLVVISISWAFAHLNIIRAFRIFRALRLVTRIPTMKSLVLGTYGSFADIQETTHKHSPSIITPLTKLEPMC
jgi:hypothetical protein